MKKRELSPNGACPMVQVNLMRFCRPKLSAASRRAAFGAMVVAGALIATFTSPNSYGEEKELAAPKPEQRADPRMDAPADWLDSIEDDAPIRNEGQNLEEFRAYNYFVMHAHKFSPELLAEHSRKELTWGRLFEQGRGQYRGEIVRVQGRLKSLLWIDSTKELRGVGIKALYEAWILDPAYDNRPTCVVLSELPSGIEPAKVIHEDIWVTCDGYFFKRYLFESAQVNEKTNRLVRHLAPLVIGRTFALRAPVVDTRKERAWQSWSYFVPTLLVLLFGMIAGALLIHRWFVRGDRRAHEILANARALEFVAPTEPEPLLHPYMREPSAN